MNSKMISGATMNPTQSTHQKSILDMCELIEKNKMTIPIYQRDVSWTLKQSVDLLNYQLFGKAPVSPISINSISGEPLVTQVSFIDRKIIDNKDIMNNHYSVVDGQQRLTTNFKMYNNHEGFRNIILDLGTAKFIVNDGELSAKQIPVGVLFNKDFKYIREFISNKAFFSSQEVINILYLVRSKITQYSYTLNVANDLSEKEQIEWFEILNNAGTTISNVQMQIAKHRRKGIDFYSEYIQNYINMFDEYDSNYFKPIKTTVSYPLAALNPAYEVISGVKHKNNHAPFASDIRINELCRMDNESLRKCFDLTMKSTQRAFNFIRDNEISLPKRIDYILYLAGFIVFLKDRELEDYKDYLIEWLSSFDFTNSSNSERRDEFTKLIKRIA